MDIRPEMFDLVRAFNEARLVAMHVDLQKTFFIAERSKESVIDPRCTENAFREVGRFSQGLKHFGVPNYWLAFTANWNKTSYGDFEKINPYERSDLALHPDLKIDKNDLVFEKASTNGFLGRHQKQRCVLGNHLDENGLDTLIIDGVKAKVCFTDTIVTGLKRPNLKFYVVLDGTELSFLEFDNFVDWFNRGSTNEEKERVVFTSTQEILNTLMLASQAPPHQVA